MHPLTCVMLLTLSSCQAHYRGSYDSRNFIIREEPLVFDVDIVECPVCKETEDNWMPSNEACHIEKGGKMYKRCMFGTYVNDVCGNRLDCYMGPGERCTEKSVIDDYGKKCAPTYYCNKSNGGVCTGYEDNNLPYIINRFPYLHMATHRNQETN